MEARASVVVQSVACGLSSSCTPPSLRSPRSFALSAPFWFGALASTKRSRPVGVDEDVAVGVLDVVGQRLAGVPVDLRPAAPRARSGTPRRRASRRRRCRPACRSRDPSRLRTPSRRRPGGPPCRGPGRRWPRRRRRGAPAPPRCMSRCRAMKAPVTSGHSSWHRRQERCEDHHLAPQRGQRDRPSLLVHQRHVLRRGPVEDQALAGRRGGRRGRAAGGQQQAEGEGERRER